MINVPFLLSQLPILCVNAGMGVCVLGGIHGWECLEAMWRDCLLQACALPVLKSSGGSAWLDLILKPGIFSSTEPRPSPWDYFHVSQKPRDSFLPDVSLPHVSQQISTNWISTEWQLRALGNRKSFRIWPPLCSLWKMISIKCLEV